MVGSPADSCAIRSGYIWPTSAYKTKWYTICSPAWRLRALLRRRASPPTLAVRAVAPPATSDDDGGISRPFNFQHVVHVKVNPDSPQGFEVAESMLPFTDVRVHVLFLP